MKHLYFLLTFALFSEIVGLTKDDNPDLATILRHVNQLESDLQATKTALQDEKRHSAAEIASLRNELALKTKDVSFRVYWLGGNTGRGVPVTFDNVHYNIGNGYSNSTGKFTAPANGTYIFSVQVQLNHANQYTSINIKQSGSYVSGSWGETSTDIDAITIPVTGITHMTQGEQTWVTSDYDIRVSTSEFSGALLSAD